MVKTPQGFEHFVGIQKVTRDDWVHIKFSDGRQVKCSLSHRFMTRLGWLEAEYLTKGSEIELDGGSTLSISDIEFHHNSPVTLYDIIETESRTYLNDGGIISHNCEFISDKGTLINSRVLEQIKFKNPLRTIGDLSIFVDDLKGRKLAMACDPSEGVGQDYHAIQIIDINTLEQVAEYQNNIITQSMFTKEIVKIVKFLYEQGAEDVFYTIENNSVGNGVLNLIVNVTDPQFNQAMMVSDPGSNGRPGWRTTNPTKMKGCSTMKDLVELGKLKFHSERLVTQLKFFTKQGATFKAESGTHDDLVMGMVLCMNLLDSLGDFEEGVYETMREVSFDEGDPDEELWGIMF